jgi:hypothetical protein
MKKAFHTIGSTLVIMILLGITKPVILEAGSGNDIPRISVDDAKQLMDDPNVVIIDVRTQKTWWSSTTKISGAVRENPSKVSEWMGKYSKTQTLLFYCT